MKNKANINYWIDVVIGVAFIVSALSGLVLLFAGPSGGYQGGRNPAYTRQILFLARDMWKNVHNWSSIALIAGVGAHLVFHLNWILCMTKNLFKRQKSTQRLDCEIIETA